MRTLYSVAVFSIFLSPTFGQGLVDVLTANGFNEFVAGLQAYPDLVARVTGRNDITVWAPVDGSVPSSENTTASARRLFKRSKAADYSTQISHSGNPPPKAPPNKKRQLALPDSNFVTLKTFLEDSEYVNLGPQEPGRVVSNYAAPPPGETEATIEISSGGGDVANLVSGPFKYDNGIIYGVNKFFALPQPLIPTLTSLGLTTFRDAIVNSGEEDKLSNTAAMTIFSYGNPEPGTPAPKVAEYTITGFLGFSPELYETDGPFKSDAGTDLTITFSGGSFFVNGIRIVKTDIIVKNGVVHQLERPLGSNTTVTKPDPVDQFTGSAVKTNPHLAAIFAAIITAAGFMRL